MSMLTPAQFLWFVVILAADVLKTIYTLLIPAVPLDCLEVSVFAEVCSKVCILLYASFRFILK